MKWLYCWLNKNKEENFICVDDDDFEFLKKFSTFTDQNNHAFIYNHITKRKERIHRIISKASPIDWIFFKDGHKWNCQKENLSKTPYQSEPTAAPQITEEERREAFAYRYWIANENLKLLSPNKKRRKIINNRNEIFDSVEDASTKLNLRPNAIYKCLSGHSKSTNGISWKYLNKPESSL